MIDNGEAESSSSREYLKAQVFGIIWKISWAVHIVSWGTTVPYVSSFNDFLGLRTA